MSLVYQFAASAILISVWALLFPLLSRTRRVPGPFMAKRSRVWYAWRLFQQDFHTINQALHKKHGSIVEVMPKYFSVDDPSMHRYIYGYNQPWIKGESYEAWHVGPGLTNLFSERDPKAHATMRRKVSNMYSMTSLTSYEPYVDLCIKLTCSHLDSFATSGAYFDLTSWMRCYAFDSIYMITFGKRLGFLDEGKDVAGLIKRLDKTRQLHTFFSVYPWIMPVVHLWRYITTRSNQLYHQRFAIRSIEHLRGEVESQTDTTDSGPACMVKHLLIAQRDHRDSDKRISDWDISRTAGVNIGAGSETTATQLASTLFFVFQHPHVLSALRKEIDSANLAQIPSFADVQKLPFLQAVVNESLRIFPSTALPLWRQVPQSGVELAGKFFPGGTNIGISAWVVNFNHDIYGHDADVFRPERWIDARSNHTRKYGEENFMTFGSGTRTCIGKNVAALEIMKLLPVLIRDYDFSFFNRDKTRNTDTSIKGLATQFVKPDCLMARCEKRIHSVSESFL